MIIGDEKETLYFAVYVNVRGASAQKATRRINEMKEHMKSSGSDRYEEIFFFFPVQDRDSGMELLYPSPAMTQEQIEEFNDRINNLGNESIR